jgi:hypothetical protein
VKPSELRDELNDESFRRVVGTRRRPPVGEPPAAHARAALAAMARYRTGAPKGVFRYKSHEDANRDREAWSIAAAVR